MKFLKILTVLLMLAGLGLLGLNFFHPKVAKATMKAVKEPTIVKTVATKAGVALQNEDEDANQPTKLYVKIENKLYEYNPQNTYMVKGIPTMYKNGEPKTLAQINNEITKAESTEKNADLKAVEEMAQQGALSVYTPGGMQKVMDGARAAADVVNERNKALGEIDQ